MTHHSDILRVLKETSRTFFIPIVRLPSKLQETIGAAYLCMRAIDEIEDHPTLDKETKAEILHNLSWALQAQLASQDPADASLLDGIFAPYLKVLPEVTLRIGDWLAHTPAGIAPRIWDATIAMADRMAYWVEKNWLIESEADLNSYTFSVAGAVGLLICDIWAWFDGTQVDRLAAIHFGRGLQSVNILRNRGEDAERGVNFFPANWTDKQMYDYARRNLDLAKDGISLITKDSFKTMVNIPLALAEATLEALESGQPKLTRQQVLQIVGQV
ncbi:MAG TPA: phytoene/squalene synthase family protein [Anaerolineales bacterium]|nr:phytoene/squalene synthase family protein [Anaerolineales bacterium]